MGYLVEVNCDRCGRGFRWENYPVGITYAKRIARDNGWSVGKEWLCPYCRLKKKKE